MDSRSSCVRGGEAREGELKAENKKIRQKKRENKREEEERENKETRVFRLFNIIVCIFFRKITTFLCLLYIHSCI